MVVQEESSVEKAYKYETIVADLTDKIKKGRYQPGDSLPSIRELCQQYGVSASTVNMAYLMLETAELVEIRPRSGCYVREQVRSQLAVPSKSKPNLITQCVDLNDVIMNIATASLDEEVVPFGMVAPDPAFIPFEALNRELIRVCRQNNPRQAYYDFPPGCYEFRYEVTRLALKWGGSFDPNEVVNTSGALEAVNLALETVCKPGDVVAIESPTYYCYLQMLQIHGLQALEMPTDPVTGIDMEVLSEAMRQGRVHAVLLIANYNNPMGFVMPEDHKRALVQLAAQYQIPVIEDDVYGDVSYAPVRPKPIKAFDTEGWVLYCASMSKSLIPGYRAGWCLPGRYEPTYKRLKWMSTAANASLQLPAMAAFLKAGGFDRHLKQFRPKLRALNHLMAQAIEACFPPDTKLSRPEGGYVFWVEFPDAVDTLALYQTALANQISFSPGAMFSIDPTTYRSSMRLNFCFEWTPRIERAVTLLGQWATEQLKGTR